MLRRYKVVLSYKSGLCGGYQLTTINKNKAIKTLTKFLERAGDHINHCASIESGVYDFSDVRYNVTYEVK